MSSHTENLNDYLKLRRSLGFELKMPERHLRKFVAFLEHQSAEFVTTQLALQWATSSTTVQPSEWANLLRSARLFAKYLSGLDPRTEIPPLGLLPHRWQRTTPYIYSSDDLSRILQCARQLSCSSELRRLTMVTVICLLAVTGMRISEIAALDREDLDTEEGILHIRRTKFGKSRLVALHPTTQRALLDYARRRDLIAGKPRTTRFFINDQFQPLPDHTVRYAFVRICRLVGLRGQEASHGPRLHDFRHSFAVKTLIQWYQKGLDAERELPKLSTYLGHGHWSDTYWYLTGIPELMGLASARLERAFGGPA